ncbi:MAG: ABC transporter permease, partial [Acidobacteriota bacterium]
MRAIHRKLLRDLWEIKGQVIAIATVIGVGIAMFLAYLSTFNSLRGTQEAYYDRYRFADVFANAKRVPLDVLDRIEQIPGVAQAEARVVADVTLDVAGMEEPITGHLVSAPEVDRATLNDMALLRGRYLEPGRGDEVLVTEGFADAHGIGPGDTVGAVINGSRRELEIVGVALSPEFVYSIRPGEMVADDARYGIFWMGEKALSNAFDMEGAFNDVLLRLLPGASIDEAIDRLDRLLEPYGGRGAIPRRLQTSHFFLDNELRQLQGFGLAVPILFLAVAIFLLNVVLGRIVSVQREQIAALK